jgi:hypothetical protein
MPQGLLKRHARDITEPWVLLLEGWQQGRERMVVELFTMLGIGNGAGIECPIVDEATTSERLRKHALLFVGGSEPIVVCALRLAHSRAFLLFLDVICKSRQDLPVERSIVAFSNFSYLFQQMSGKPYGQRLDIFFHATIVTSMWLRVNGFGTPVPELQLRNTPSIPMAKARGFTARFDKVSSWF